MTCACGKPTFMIDTGVRPVASDFCRECDEARAGTSRDSSLSLTAAEPATDDCCDDEANQYEDDSDCVVCRTCKEWTTEVKCQVCEETIFESACCG